MRRRNAIWQSCANGSVARAQRELDLNCTKWDFLGAHRVALPKERIDLVATAEGEWVGEEAAHISELLASHC